MRVSLKILGVVLISGTPLVAGPALAQPGWSAIGHQAASKAAQTPIRAEPVSMAARQAVAAAPFAKPGPKRLDLTVRGDDKLRDDVELRGKDTWSDEEGFQFKMTKVAYTRRF